MFRCELQCQKAPVASATFFWHIRWIVDWLGGHAGSNFIGQGARSWINKVSSYLSCLFPEMDSVEELAKSHFLQSGNSKLRQSPREDGKEKEEAEVSMSEYSASSFGLLVMVLHWAARGPNKGSQWKLPGEQVRSQAVSFLKLLTDTFVVNNLCMPLHGASVILLGEKGDGVQLDWQVLCHTEGFKILERVFACYDAPLVNVVDALLLLCKEEVNSRVSATRRSASTQAIATLIDALVSVIESSKLDSVWQETELWQLQALRTGSKDVCVLLLESEWASVLPMMLQVRMHPSASELSCRVTCRGTCLKPVVAKVGLEDGV